MIKRPAERSSVGLFCVRRSSCEFKSNVRETWCVILVSKADIFHTESLRISVAFVPFHVTGISCNAKKGFPDIPESLMV